MSDPTSRLAREYSQKAGAYARYWAPVLRPLAQPLLPELPLGTAGRILDVGTGTGVLLPALESAASHATVIGVDRAPGMLRQIDRARHPALAVMDAQCLAVRPESVDVAVLAFVLFHVEDASACLRELHRALRPGGVLGVTTWGPGSDLPGLSVWIEELDTAGAAPDPRDARVMSEARMDSPEKLERLLVDAGFDPTRWLEVPPVRVPSKPRKPRESEA